MSGSTSKPCQYNHAAYFYMPTIAFVSRETHQAYTFRVATRVSTAHSVVDYVCVYASSKAQNRIEYESFEPIGVVRTVFIISIHKHTIEIAGRCV